VSHWFTLPYIPRILDKIKTIIVECRIFVFGAVDVINAAVLLKCAEGAYLLYEVKLAAERSTRVGW